MNPGSTRCGHWTVFEGWCTYCGLDEDSIDREAQSQRVFQVICRAYQREKARSKSQPKFNLSEYGRSIGLTLVDANRINSAALNWSDSVDRDATRKQIHGPKTNPL